MIYGLFWIFLLLILYCYLGYPLSLCLLTKFISKPVQKANIFPQISIVLSVWNEADVIESKINNLLSLNYPKDRMEILIGSDGSTDKTNEIIKRFKNPRVHLFEGTQRRGKMATINELVSKSQSDIIVFTDARQMFSLDALKELMANFAQPDIGCVSGELIFSKKGGATARGINLYWNYEKFIRSQESKIHSMLGATGAIYAIRRHLYTEVPTNVVLDDMYIPLKIIQKGYRAIFDEKAQAFDEVADSPREEHRRKARTLFGNYQIFGILPELFNPYKNPVSIQLFSHKFLRVIIPFFMIAVVILNLFLLNESFYRQIFILQVIFYIAAVLGGLLRHKRTGALKWISKICYIPYVFCLLNFSALIGFFRFMGTGQTATWEKARELS